MGNLKEYMQAMAGMVAGGANMAEYNYSSVYDFVLDQGRECPATARDEELAARITNWLPWQPQLKECYYNAQFFSLYWGERATYMEGIATSGLLPVNHAWNVVDGKVVDLTWRANYQLAFDIEQSAVGNLPDNWAYYGVPLEPVLIHDMWVSTGEARPLIDDWSQGFPLLKAWPRRGPPVPPIVLPQMTEEVSDVQAQ